MNRNRSIYIFSRSTGSGKTTQLREWIKSQNNVGGFLTPDVEGLRMLFDIHKQKLHPFQVMENYTGQVVNIGRFRFSMSGFEIGRNIIANASSHWEWLIIDEAGKLEINQGEGYEPEILKAVRRFQSGEMKGNLLLVVRDTLLIKAIEKYNLQGCNILNDSLPL